MAAEQDEQRVGRVHILHALFGVLLPVVALGFELQTRVSDEIYFDPIPTWWHVLLIAAVPLANLHAAWVLRTGRSAHALWSLRATAFVLAVSCFYALLYLPILPLSVLAVLVYGLGLLPYAPLLAALLTWRVRRRLRQSFPEAVVPARARWAALAGVACLVVFETGGWLAQAGFSMADSDDAGRRRQGIALLRSAALEAPMLRVVHYGRGHANLTGHLLLGKDLVRFIPNSNLAHERDAKTYYRVTGLSVLDTLPPPRPTTDRSFFEPRRRTGMTRVLPELALASSRLDGTVHPEAELVYLEWTLVLRNDYGRDQEARAHVLLPPNAAVTRATLWVGDEPRDAAFGPRQAVTEAYERVTARRRDPLLVNAAGRDRVSIRCFPVPARGTMKIRLGITAPLALDAEHGALRLPELVMPNFVVGPALEQSVWIDSPVGFVTLPAGLTSVRDAGRFALRGTLAAGDRTWLELERGHAVETWAADAVSPNGVAITQRIEAAETRVDRVVAVVDASSSMEEHVGEIADALAELPSSIELGIVVAGDAALELLAPGDPREAALYLLRRSEFVGGQDDVPALEMAFERAESVPRAAVLWIHPPLPLTLSSPVALQQRFEHRRDGPRWLDLQTSPGADALAVALTGVAPLEPIPRRKSVGQDLSDALERLAETAPSFVAVRQRRLPPAGVGVAPQDSAHSTHISRLWARDEVLALLRIGGVENYAEAAALGTRYRVVTPVSGAVVLETDLQYTENDLAAPKAGVDDALAAAAGSDFETGDTPLAGVPEPGTGALTALGLTMLAAWRHRRRQARLR